MYIVATLIGLMMTCTLFTAKAAEYRKEVNVEYSTTKVDLVNAIILDYKNYQVTNPYAFIVPVNDYFLITSESYIKPVNDGKPDNRRINGLINDNSSKHRIRLYPTS